MLDSAGIMMSQYQSLSARLQLTAVTPATAVNGSADSSVYDMPSTSATAMAQLETHQVTPTAAASSASPTMPAEKVTIEDLGADADEDDIPSTATEAVSIPNSDADFEENSSESNHSIG